MIRFNRRRWILSIRTDQLSDIAPDLLPAALALQAAVIADGLTDGVCCEDYGAPGRRALRRSARRARPEPRRSASRARHRF